MDGGGYSEVEDDILKAADVIKDDRWQFHIRPPLVHQPIVDKENPRVEVKICHG